MSHSFRTGSVAILVATATLATGCGGGGGSKTSAADSQLVAAAAAASSAEVAIARLSSKLASLSAPTPAATSAGPVAATSAAPAPGATTGGLPVVPSGAALSSPSATPSATSAAAPLASNLAAAESAVNHLLGGASAQPGAGVIAGALSQTDETKYCSAIPHADIQALVKATVGPVIEYPFQCAWKGTGVKVSVNPDDNDVKGSSTLIGSDGKTITGVGDTAKWDSPVPNMTVPNVYAQKGANFTCYVEGDYVPTSSIAYTGKDPFFTITNAAELAYATKEAKLCADVFAVS